MRRRTATQDRAAATHPAGADPAEVTGQAGADPAGVTAPAGVGRVSSVMTRADHHGGNQSSDEAERACKGETAISLLTTRGLPTCRQASIRRAGV